MILVDHWLDDVRPIVAWAVMPQGLQIRREGSLMAQTGTLTVTSLLSILLFSLHWADEIARGIEPGTIDRTWGGLLILFVWLYGVLAIPERRTGLVIILLGAVLASGVPVLHMQGRGLVGGRIAVDATGTFFWVWTNVALGACGTISLALAVRALWSRLARQTPIGG